MELRGAIVSEYKSVSLCEVPLGGLTVLFGPNGAGKTNLLEAIGLHDPIARTSLARDSRPGRRPHARVGLVMALDAAMDGTGLDAELFRDMLASPWAEGLPADEITEGVGAYCGSTWWIDGGDLYNPADRESLSRSLSVIRAALLVAVPQHALVSASHLVDLLLERPTVIVQEDFAVELSVDRETRAGREALTDALSLRGELSSGALSHVVGVLTDWTGRWPPLTVLTRGPSGAGRTPSGFEWVAKQFGGVQVVSGDVPTLERHLDAALDRVHDKLMHQPEGLGDADTPFDEGCDVCLHPDHGGRVDPAVYADPDAPDGDFADLPFAYPGSPSWLETSGEWTRVRSTIREALVEVARVANDRLVPFVADAGAIVLDIRPPTEWGNGGERCAVSFALASGDAEPPPADWGGRVGVRGLPTAHGVTGPLTLPLASLGAGMRRWVAAAVRLAVDEMATPETEDPHGFDVSPKIVLIDEPEQHLHPEAQHSVAAWCLRESRRHHSVLVATHSASFLALPPEAVTTCQVSRLGHQTMVRPLPPVHGTGVVLRARELGFELGLGRDALAQLTRAVVVVEGEWDRQMLYRFFGPDLATQRALVVPLQGSDELGGMADAAVIPALGVTVVALLDEVRASSAADFDQLATPLTKAERALRDLCCEMGPGLVFARYGDPDVICGLPGAAVRRAFPEAFFPGWEALLDEWRAEGERDGPPAPFKRWALARMGLPKRHRMPAAFFRLVLEHVDDGEGPSPEFAAAAKHMLALIAADAAMG